MAILVIDNESIEVPDNSPILEACEDLGVPFGCQAGECATCVIQIQKGMENLAEMTTPEKIMGLSGNERLACQAVIRSGTVWATY